MSLDSRTFFSDKQIQKIKLRSFVERIGRVVLQLKMAEPKEVNSAEFARIVGTQVVLAKSYGLRSERDVATFVLSAYILGLGFDENFPDVNAALKDDNFSSEQKAIFLQVFTQELIKGLKEESIDEVTR